MYSSGKKDSWLFIKHREGNFDIVEGNCNKNKQIDFSYLHKGIWFLKIWAEVLSIVQQTKQQFIFIPKFCLV